MTSARWDTGRVNQKLRTRQALMDTAVELVNAGLQPSVEAVADRVGVSRATAYRYFPSRELMLSEALVRAGTTDDVNLTWRRDANMDPAERAARVTRRGAQFALEHEERLRTALRLSLDPQSGYQRPGRRGQWVAEMLGPLKDTLDEPLRRRLTAALHLVVGVDAIVVLTDIAGMDRDQAIDTLEWMAATLVNGAINEHERQGAGTSGRPRPARAKTPATRRSGPTRKS